METLARAERGSLLAAGEEFEIIEKNQSDIKQLEITSKTRLSSCMRSCLGRPLLPTSLMMMEKRVS